MFQELRWNISGASVQDLPATADFCCTCSCETTSRALGTLSQGAMAKKGNSGTKRSPPENPHIPTGNRKNNQFWEWKKGGNIDQWFKQLNSKYILFMPLGFKLVKLIKNILQSVQVAVALRQAVNDHEVRHQADTQAMDKDQGHLPSKPKSVRQ